MSLNAVDLLTHIIIPTLQTLDMHSPDAEQWLVATAAQSSGFNPFARGDAGIGLYQISSAQHRSAWDDYLAFRPELASRVRGFASQHQFLKDPDLELTTNLSYSTAIAWVVYLQANQALHASPNAA